MWASLGVHIRVIVYQPWWLPPALHNTVYISLGLGSSASALLRGRPAHPTVKGGGLRGRAGGQGVQPAAGSVAAAAVGVADVSSLAAAAVAGSAAARSKLGCCSGSAAQRGWRMVTENGAFVPCTLHLAYGRRILDTCRCDLWTRNAGAYSSLARHMCTANNLCLDYLQQRRPVPPGGGPAPQPTPPAATPPQNPAIEQQHGTLRPPDKCRAWEWRLRACTAWPPELCRGSQKCISHSSLRCYSWTSLGANHRQPRHG